MLILIDVLCVMVITTNKALTFHDIGKNFNRQDKISPDYDKGQTTNLNNANVLDTNNNDYYDYNYVETPQQSSSLSSSSSSIHSSSSSQLSSLKPSITPSFTQHKASQYMLDLYQKFSNDKYSHPIADIVRGFVSVQEDPEFNSMTWHYKGMSKTWNHTMAFNISSIDSHEIIQLAELRFCSLSEKDLLNKKTPDRKVTLYEIFRKADEVVDYQTILSREVRGHHAEWETYSVTEVLKRWIKSDKYENRAIMIKVETIDVNNEDVTKSVRTQRYNSYNDPDRTYEEVIKEHFRKTDDDDDDGTSIEHPSFEPILVVFSNDRGNKKSGEFEELNESEKQETIESLAEDELNEEIDDLDDEESDNFNFSNDIFKRKSNVTLNRKKRQVGNGFGKKNRKLRDSCRRRKMYINFEDIHWNNWIVQPRGYQAYECVGECHFPLKSHLTPKKYTAIKSLFHATFPRKVKPVCCVPTKLQPISMLYYDENNVLTYKFKYEEMMVAKCGCR